MFRVGSGIETRANLCSCLKFFATSSVFFQYQAPSTFQSILTDKNNGISASRLITVTINTTDYEKVFVFFCISACTRNLCNEKRFKGFVHFVVPFSDQT